MLTNHRLIFSHNDNFFGMIAKSYFSNKNQTPWQHHWTFCFILWYRRNAQYVHLCYLYNTKQEIKNDVFVCRMFREVDINHAKSCSIIDKYFNDSSGNCQLVLVINTRSNFYFFTTVSLASTPLQFKRLEYLKKHSLMQCKTIRFHMVSVDSPNIQWEITLALIS